MKFLSLTGLKSQPFKLKKGHRTLLFTVDELEQLEDEIKRALLLTVSRAIAEGARKATEKRLSG